MSTARIIQSTPLSAVIRGGTKTMLGLLRIAKVFTSGQREITRVQEPLLSRFVHQGNPFGSRAGWLKGNIQGYEYCFKAYKKPSQIGIDGGRISKLEIRKDGVLVAHYDRGWDVEPVSQDAKDIVTILCMSMS